MLPLNNTLKRRAKYLKKIRKFFEDKSVLEVDTPISYPYPVTDPYIDAFSIDTQSGMLFLQTSPEYAMKQLLAKGSGSIYQICKAFRNEPKAKYHNHEFTMLEWYQLAIDDKGLRQEIIEMLLFLNDNFSIHQFSYQYIFNKVLGVDSHQISEIELQILVKEKIGQIEGMNKPNQIECLDLLFTHCIEPCLKQYHFVFIYDYPQVQAALSRVMCNERGQIVAKRFELFFKGVELANGYYELTNAFEQRQRFEQDLLTRQQIKKQPVPIDELLLACLGDIPQCSGVSLGIDRLLMCFEGYDQIDEVLYCISKG